MMNYHFKFKNNHVNIDDLSEQISSAILAEPYFDKQGIKVKLKVFLSDFIKNTPISKDPKKQELEKASFQEKYWKDVVRMELPHKIEQYSNQLTHKLKKEFK